MAIMNTTLLDQMIDPLAECLTVDAARRIAALRADASTQRRFDELAAKANFGNLSEEERLDYDLMMAALHVVTLMQVRARRFLAE